MCINASRLFIGLPFKGPILNVLCMPFLFTANSISLYCSSNKAVSFKKKAASHINEILVSSAFHISLTYNSFFKNENFIEKCHLPKIFAFQ